MDQELLHVNLDMINKSIYVFNYLTLGKFDALCELPDIRMLKHAYQEDQASPRRELGDGLGDGHSTRHSHSQISILIPFPINVFHGI